MVLWLSVWNVGRGKWRKEWMVSSFQPKLRSWVKMSYILFFTYPGLSSQQLSFQVLTFSTYSSIQTLSFGGVENFSDIWTGQWLVVHSLNVYLLTRNFIRCLLCLLVLSFRQKTTMESIFVVWTSWNREIIFSQSSRNWGWFHIFQVCIFILLLMKE